MRHVLRGLGIVAGIVLWAGSPIEPNPSQDASPLELKVSGYEVRAVSIVDALRELKARIRGGNVVLTLEVAPFDQEPEKNLTLALGDATVRDVLDTLVAQDPRYTYQVVGSELVHVFPDAASKDPKNLLNTNVKVFSISGVPYDLMLKYPNNYVPELAAELARRSQYRETVGHMMGGVGVPTITVTLKDVTVRDILNEVARQAAIAPKPQRRPTGWIYTFRVDKLVPLGGHPRWELF